MASMHGVLGWGPVTNNIMCPSDSEPYVSLYCVRLQVEVYGGERPG
jgi:hypothetical protein